MVFASKASVGKST